MIGKMFRSWKILAITALVMGGVFTVPGPADEPSRPGGFFQFPGHQREEYFQPEPDRATSARGPATTGGGRVFPGRHNELCQGRVRVF